MTANQQLELGFNGTSRRIYGRRREGRAERGQWWFAQMRAVVAGAVAWPPADGSAAEQIAIPGITREAQL